MSQDHQPKVFVTGGSGFVGSNLVAGLNDIGIQPWVLHRENSSLAALQDLRFNSVIGDVLDKPSDLASSMDDCDWVFHAAAVSDYWRMGIETLYKVNVEGTKNVLAASKMANVGRFIFTSSLGALGIPDNDQPITENSSFNLEPKRLPYGHSKHLAEVAVLEANGNELETVLLNPSVILGPRDHKQISGSIVTEAARGLLRFNLPGSVSFVAVEDVVKGHILAAQKAEPGERYILSGTNLTLKEAGAVVCQVVGRPVPKFDVPLWLLSPAAIAVGLARSVLGNRIPMDANQVRLTGKKIIADSRKAQEAFGMQWTPFREMVERTYRWYVDNGYI